MHGVEELIDVEGALEGVTEDEDSDNEGQDDGQAGVSALRLVEPHQDLAPPPGDKRDEDQDDAQEVRVRIWDMVCAFVCA